MFSKPKSKRLRSGLHLYLRVISRTTGGYELTNGREESSSGSGSPYFWGNEPVAYIKESGWTTD